MSTIHMELTEEGIQEAIDKLNDWVTGKLEPYVGDVNEYVASMVYADMYATVHIGDPRQQKAWDVHDPGRLQRSIRMFNVDSDSGLVATAEIVADAVDNKGNPYANKERTRGDDQGHDFASLVTVEDRKAELTSLINGAADMYRSNL